MNQSVVGWVDAYEVNYPVSTFTSERRKALIERIRKRKYNFNFTDHQFLPYSAPFYNDNTFCVLNKQQWDSVMNEAYKDIPLGARLTPMDVIKIQPKNGILYEKEKYANKEFGENV